MNRQILFMTLLISFFIGLLLFLAILITLTYMISFRVMKIERPKLKWLFMIAFFQVVLGSLTIFFVRELVYDSLINSVYGLAVLFLSGLFLIKIILKLNWKQTLSFWAVAGGIQVVVVPLCSIILSLIFAMLMMKTFPPQFLIFP